MSETPEPPYQGEILKASSPGKDQIHPGMEVVGIDGESVGKVKEVREGEFLVDRPLARDVWVPFASVLEAGEQGGAFRRGPTQPSEVMLNIAAARVDDQDWEHA
jgi:hypothetical protein